MRRNIRYKPSKASAAMGLVVGILFIVLGVTVVIPATFGSGFLPAGLFGLVWTGIAVMVTVTNARYLLGKGDRSAFYGGFEISDEEPERTPSPALPADSADRQYIAPVGLNVKARLEQLETLKDAGLLTKAEYEQKRREILNDL